jgi:hypothetical protein
MTLVRRVAMAISGVVVRYASSGCKDWAEGLAHEVEFVQGDWAAFWWALGSARVLLDRREATVGSVNEAAAKAWEFSESRYREKDNKVHWFMFLQAFLYVLRLYDARSLEQRIGCGLVIVTATYMGIFLLMLRRKFQVPPESEDARAWILYYKSELEYVCSSGTFARFFVGLTFVVGGMLVAERGGIRSNPIFATSVGLVFACMTFFFAWKRRQYQYQIAALDAILQEMH